MTRRPKRDRRYRIAREFCGAPRARHVARFCGDWIGQAGTRRAALDLVKAHQAARTAAIDALAGGVTR